jgi:quercetin 2,3-dioxygenase
MPAHRGVDRVEEGLHAGPDVEVDDKWLHIRPGEPARTDPFLVLSEDRFAAAGFDWHPHRGLETVTVVLDGVLEHADTLGDSGLLAAGDVQWTTAGRGLAHREVAHRGEPVHVLQLWLNLPATARRAEPGYQRVPSADRPRVRRAGGVLDVISGTVDGVTGPARGRWPVQLVVVTVEPGGMVELPVPAADRAFALVLAGTAHIGGCQVPAGHLAWSEPVPAPAGTPTRLTLGAPDGAKVLVGSGPPVGEPVVVDGGFVMNHPEEIAQARRDLAAGAFGPVPPRAM